MVTQDFTNKAVRVTQSLTEKDKWNFITFVTKIHIQIDLTVSGSHLSKIKGYQCFEDGKASCMGVE